MKSCRAQKLKIRVSTNGFFGENIRQSLLKLAQIPKVDLKIDVSVDGDVVVNGKHRRTKTGGNYYDTLCQNVAFFCKEKIPVRASVVLPLVRTNVRENFTNIAHQLQIEQFTIAPQQLMANMGRFSSQELIGLLKTYQENMEDLADFLAHPGNFTGKIDNLRGQGWYDILQVEHGITLDVDGSIFQTRVFFHPFSLKDFGATPFHIQTASLQEIYDYFSAQDVTKEVDRLTREYLGPSYRVNYFIATLFNRVIHRVRQLPHYTQDSYYI